MNSLISFTSAVHDPFHVNDVEVAQGVEGPYILNGDIFLSVRHLNAILQIRNDSIIKTITGGFNMQHDIDITSDSTISIFNNNSGGYWVNISKVNSNIVNKNLSSGEEWISFSHLNMSTATEGQVQYLSSGRVLIENQNQHELIVLDDNEVVFRGKIESDTRNNYVEILTWVQAFEHDPIKM